MPVSGAKNKTAPEVHRDRLGDTELPVSGSTNGGRTSLNREDNSQQNECPPTTSESGESYDEHELPPLRLNYEAIKHIATYYISGEHGACINIRRLTRGSFHEIELLEYEDGWMCIGRFLRSKQSLGLAESEVATMRYVRKHTTIPVPEIYFVNYNADHAVGAAFMLMGRMPGTTLDQIWDDLSLDHKKGVISQVADVLAQLASLEFDTIGSLTENGVGPIRERQYDQDCNGLGPFQTLEGYFMALIDVDKASHCCEECITRCQEIRDEVRKFFSTRTDLDQICEPPYVLLHGDFDSQNMLFQFDDKNNPPQLTGIIDWDGSVTHSLYFANEYPPFVRDSHYCQEQYAENKILRQHLVREVANHYPEGSKQRQLARDAFYKKCYFLHEFVNVVAVPQDEHELQASYLKFLIEYLHEGGWGPYRGRSMDWEPDTDSESEEPAKDLDDDSDTESSGSEDWGGGSVESLGSERVDANEGALARE